MKPCRPLQPHSSSGLALVMIGPTLRGSADRRPRSAKHMLGGALSGLLGLTMLAQRSLFFHHLSLKSFLRPPPPHLILASCSSCLPSCPILLVLSLPRVSCLAMLLLLASSFTAFLLFAPLLVTPVLCCRRLLSPSLSCCLALLLSLPRLAVALAQSCPRLQPSCTLAWRMELPPPWSPPSRPFATMTSTASLLSPTTLAAPSLRSLDAARLSRSGSSTRLDDFVEAQDLPHHGCLPDLPHHNDL